MSHLKTIVCFANSRKTSCRCVAGKEVHASGAGAWVRPVSDRSSHEVSEEERRYKDGGDPQLLDIIKVSCARHDPVSRQHESHVIDPNDYWSKEGRVAWGTIHVWLDHPANL
ncbi:MAG: dual OB domain-containing protein [Pseudomonadota bacterium]